MLKEAFCPCFGSGFFAASLYSTEGGDATEPRHGKTLIAKPSAKEL